MTWWSGPDRVSLLFNRDERKTRLPAVPPTVDLRHGVRFIAPRDGNFGGTWMLVNAHGLILAILNHYPAEAPEPADAPTSRGLLPLAMAEFTDAGAVDACLRQRDLRVFQPFRLAALAPGQPLRLWTWDGRALVTSRALRQPVSSSSVRPAAVEAARLAAYRMIARDGPPGPDRLEAFHRTTGAWPPADPEAICMTRSDAETVSLSRVDVSEDSIRFVYYPRRPEAERRSGEDPFAVPTVRTLPGALISA